MARMIQLTKGQVTLVDDEWYPILSQYTWYCAGNPSKNKPLYAARRVRVEGESTGRLVFMHHYIMPRQPGLFVDHINGNGLDNRAENLRYCTVTQNNHNTGGYKVRKSRYKGVTPGKIPGTWRANIYLDGKQTLLGIFDSEEAAAAAYNAAAMMARGEFARLNDVPDQPYIRHSRKHGGRRARRSGIEQDGHITT